MEIDCYIYSEKPMKISEKGHQCDTGYGVQQSSSSKHNQQSIQIREYKLLSPYYLKNDKGKKMIPTLNTSL